jgi:hypothetical protein
LLPAIFRAIVFPMLQSRQSHVLTPQQLSELNQRLSCLCHNVNNHLSLIMAATDLIQRKPEATDRALEAMRVPPEEIARELRCFCSDLEQILGLSNP